MKKIPRLEFEEPLLDEISSQLIDECINKDYLKIFFSKLDREYAIEVLKKYLKSRVESDFYLFDQEYNLYLYAIQKERDRYDQLKKSYEDKEVDIYVEGYKTATSNNISCFRNILKEEGYTDDRISELLSDLKLISTTTNENDE